MGSDNIFRKRKERSKTDLRRSAEKKSPYETVLIVCEGEKTEVNYFKGLIQNERLNTANIEITHSEKGSAPISIVECAIKNAEAREGLDRVFCVFDRDSHPSYELAINKINSYKSSRKSKSKPRFEVIVSSPCFEIWILLHFVYTTKSYNRTDKRSSCDKVVTDLKKHISDYEKNIDNLYEQTKQYHERAISNAEKLKNDNIQTNSTNPATNVHTLIQYLINLKNNNNA